MKSAVNGQTKRRLSFVEIPAALSPTERRVLTYIAKKWTSKQISEVMGVSPNTVDNHRTSIRRRLGVTSSEEAVAKARKLRLLIKDDER